MKNQPPELKRIERFVIEYPRSDLGRKDWNKRFSLNSIYSGKPRNERRGDANEWHSICAAAMLKAKIPKKPFCKPVKVTFYWNDGLDVDNHAYMGKMIVDGMKGWLLSDDTKRYFKQVTHAFHSENYILVEVAEI
ncbi:MAG: hypothetical protein RR365_11295 [Bacteroides sp.]